MIEKRVFFMYIHETKKWLFLRINLFYAYLKLFINISFRKHRLFPKKILAVMLMNMLKQLKIYHTILISELSKVCAKNLHNHRNSLEQICINIGKLI